jgi:C-terminal processing protease CtpA/Prc
MNRDWFSKNSLYLLFVFLSLAFSTSGQQQQQPKISKFERDEVLQMLSAVSDDVKKHYYDPQLHEIDWDENVKNFRQRTENAASLNRGLSEVAAALDVLNDSHTFFLPPHRPYKHDYGWRIGMVGRQCMVLGVRPESDAEKKGVKPGDEVMSINGFAPARENLWKMNFVHNVLRPQPGLRVSLRSPTGEKRDVEVVAAVRQLPKTRDLTGGGIWEYIRELETEGHLQRMQWRETEGGVMILKFPAFLFTQGQVDDVMKKARKNQALIIDLRGNGGGSVETLKEFLSNLFDHDVKIADRKMRDNSKPVLAKSSGKDAFVGKLIVLVDSMSGSASEILARVIQLEKRGTVIGDQSAGAVMEARRYSYKIGFETQLFYGASITDADLIMTDGKSLEKVGVTPDELLLPNAADLAAGRDPILARAVQLAGGKMTPETAGKLFPYEWAKE